MNKKLLTVAICMALSTGVGYAHHPAADNENMPDGTWEMIDANVADTPHGDMTFDDMGGAMEANAEAGAEASMESRGGAAEGAYMEANEEAGTEANMETRSEAGEEANQGAVTMGDDRRYMLERQTGDDNQEAAADAAESVDTFDLMEDVVSAIDSE